MSTFFRNPITLALATGLLASTALLGGYAHSRLYSAQEHQVNQAAAVSTAAPQGGRDFSAVGFDFATIAAQQGPAVVNISVSGKTRTSAGWPGGSPVDPDDPFYEFFRRFQGPQGQAPVHGQGSGFIVKSDGVVLTNAHVVANADEVTVKLTDRREFKARVTGVDKLSDVAVLKIDAKDLPTVKIGDPQKSRVGEWVVAIGSPFGFENSVTAGIVSAKSRTLPDEGHVPFLQTDVAINPGNSGGPLFNMNGEVIGINSQIYSRSGGYQGLSFAIPIDVAMKVERQLLDKGKVSRGRLGIGIQDLASDLAQSLGMERPAGALVGSVENGSPAQKAGIEPGDVVVKFNGVDIQRSSELPPLVSDAAPGSKAQVTVWRQGKLRDLSVVLGEVKADPATELASAGDASDARLGIAVRPLNAQERRDAKLVSGLKVEGVSSGPAARAGLRPGDVILSVNGALVNSAEQLRSAVKAQGTGVALQVLRDNQRVYIPIQVG